jgi:hypothetical protein
MPPYIPFIWLAIVVGAVAFFGYKTYRPRLMLSDPSNGTCRHKWIKSDTFFRVISNIVLNDKAYTVRVFAYGFACIKCGAMSSKDSVLEPELERNYNAEKP